MVVFTITWVYYGGTMDKTLASYHSSKKMADFLSASNESTINPDYRYPQAVNPKPIHAPIQAAIPTYKFGMHPGTVWLFPIYDKIVR
jgi:hypothetical protein